MKIILRYIALPFLILGTVIVAVRIAWGYSPILVIALFSMLIIAMVVRGFKVKRADARRGWRVGHLGRDQMFYEEIIGGSWERIQIDGEMLVGDAHHVIYFPTIETWDTFPEWTRGRRREIIARVKSVFEPPGYEYEEAEQGGDGDAEEAV